MERVECGWWQVDRIEGGWRLMERVEGGGGRWKW